MGFARVWQSVQDVHANEPMGISLTISGWPVMVPGFLCGEG
jgi:hypothetical protein